jgi:hypothetical protein
VAVAEILLETVTVFKEEGDCIICLGMRADKVMRHLVFGELSNYRIVRDERHE